MEEASMVEPKTPGFAQAKPKYENTTRGRNLLIQKPNDLITK